MDYAKLTYANLDICTVEKQYIYMHILDTTYWYLDLVSITYFVYIVHTVHVYIYIHVGQETIPPATIGLAAEKTPPPLPQGGEPSGWGGRGVGVPAHIYIYIYPIVFPFIYHPHCNSMHHPMNNWPLLAQSCPEKRVIQSWPFLWQSPPRHPNPGHFLLHGLLPNLVIGLYPNFWLITMVRLCYPLVN